MGAGSDKKPLASPRDFFPGRKGRVAELFPKFLGRSFLAFSHFAAVDHHIMRVALSLDLDFAKLDQSCFHISMFCWIQPQGKRQGILTFAERSYHRAPVGIYRPDPFPFVYVELMARGVKFEKYDMPDIDEKGISTAGGAKAA